MNGIRFVEPKEGAHISGFSLSTEFTQANHSLPIMDTVLFKLLNASQRCSSNPGVLLRWQSGFAAA